jgi:hypothetical protein
LKWIVKKWISRPCVKHSAMEIYVEDVGISASMLNFCARFKCPQLLALVALCPVPIGQDVGRAPQSVSSKWKRPAFARNRSSVVTHSD